MGVLGMTEERVVSWDRITVVLYSSLPSDRHDNFFAAPITTCGAIIESGRKNSSTGAKTPTCKRSTAQFHSGSGVPKAP